MPTVKRILALLPRLHSAHAIELKLIWQSKAEALKSCDSTAQENINQRETEFLAELEKSESRGIPGSAEDLETIQVLADFILAKSAEDTGAPEKLKVLQQRGLRMTDSEKAQLSDVWAAQNSDDPWRQKKAAQARDQLLNDVAFRLAGELKDTPKGLDVSEQEAISML